jgi:hypothetical protein
MQVQIYTSSNMKPHGDYGAIHGVPIVTTTVPHRHLLHCILSQLLPAGGGSHTMHWYYRVPARVPQGSHCCWAINSWQLYSTGPWITTSYVHVT